MWCLAYTLRIRVTLQTWTCELCAYSGKYFLWENRIERSSSSRGRMIRDLLPLTPTMADTNTCRGCIHPPSLHFSVFFSFCDHCTFHLDRWNLKFPYSLTGRFLIKSLFGCILVRWLKFNHFFWIYIGTRRGLKKRERREKRDRIRPVIQERVRAF